MDGNGRWAQKRHRPRVFGHVRGARRLIAVVREADRLGVQALTVYAFSTENWIRPDSELRVLWKLMKKFLEREVRSLDRENVRLRVIGEVDRVPADLQKTIAEVTKRLEKNTGLQFTLAVSYGSRKEILLATQSLALECEQSGRDIKASTEADLERHLWTACLGDLSTVDLVVRTSGEKRVSNFLLWQSAYAEFSFIDICWPDFMPAHLEQVVRDFGSRERRYGGVQSSPAKRTELESLA
jgi:undecaprenyl diphosphate synthase